MISLNEESPLRLKIGFGKLLDYIEGQTRSKDTLIASRAKKVLEVASPFPELREGLEDLAGLDKYCEIMPSIMQVCFPNALTNNEIKLVSGPFRNVTIHMSERLKKIIADAGPGFELTIRNMPEGQMYILGCVVVLKMHYKVDLDFKRPLFYDIPDKNGIMRHYRIMYNADFMEVNPTEKAKEITPEDIDLLRDNFDNLELWRDKFPPDSWECKGFVIGNMFDVTQDTSLSDLKANLLASENETAIVDEYQRIFQSIFNSRNVRVGYAAYNKDSDAFEMIPVSNFRSALLRNETEVPARSSLCKTSYKTLFEKKEYYCVSNVDAMVDKYGNIPQYRTLQEQGYKSAILAPIANEERVMGVLEVVSTKPTELNSVNANKLVDVMPFLVAAVERAEHEQRNMVQVVIQQECTSIHQSIYWKFEAEAKRYLLEQAAGKDTSFREMVFPDVFPLYGQIDIKESSKERNLSIQRDLLIQLSDIKAILDRSLEVSILPIYEELLFRVDEYVGRISMEFQAHLEQTVKDFVENDVHPVLRHLKAHHPELEKEIIRYEYSVQNPTGSVYEHRKNYDESVMLINKKLALVIDEKQEEAQTMFPHYFERYKTDGVEHNMYIGASIVQNNSYDPIYLHNLRLWQLQVMCEMENTYYQLKPELPIRLDVASLLLVYNTPLSIRFRMDEKRFDVDGTYNARYEIIKKRLDKALIKSSKGRLTQPGMISIVYTQKKDELEYLRYIRFLRSKKYFTDKVELVELEGLQGVSGLKAIRAEVLYKKEKGDKKYYNYQDLMAELNI